MTYFINLLSIMLIALLGAGCSLNQNTDATWQDAAQDPLIQTNYHAADALAIQAGAQLSTSQPLIMATLVSIDKLDRSSTLGRLISEHISTRFTQLHYVMTEVKLRNQLYLKQEQGELMLTRELKDIASTHNAQAVIVGTYAVSQQFVFVNLKIIQPINNKILSSFDYNLPLDDNIRSLLPSKR